MEYALEGTTTAPLLPAMKRARIFICIGYLIELIRWIIDVYFEDYLINEVFYGDYKKYVDLIHEDAYLFEFLILIIGFCQLCFTKNKLYKIGGIILSAAFVYNVCFYYFIADWLKNLNISWETLILTRQVGFTAILGLGVSYLWYGCNNKAKKSLSILFCVLLFSLCAFLIYRRAYEHDYDGFWFLLKCNYLYLIIDILYLIYWWKFCSAGNPVNSESDYSSGKVLVSRTFLSFIVCVAMLTASVIILSNTILS